jgi:hypothetical protein
LCSKTRRVIMCLHMKSSSLVVCRQSSYRWVGLHSILHRMEVRRMKHYDFNDLMTFGLFLIALLTFIYMICH